MKKNSQDNFMDKLIDKNIDFLANESVSKSELEIELDKYFNDKLILTESDKKSRFMGHFFSLNNFI